MKRKSTFLTAAVSLALLGALGASAAQATGFTPFLEPNCYRANEPALPDYDGQLVYGVKFGFTGASPHAQVTGSLSSTDYETGSPGWNFGPATVEADDSGSYTFELGTSRATSYTLTVEYGGVSYTKTLPVLCADFSETEVSFTAPDAPVPVGSDGATKSVSLANAGSADLDVSGLSLEGNDPGDFSIVATDCTGVLAPDESCEAQVAFSPQADGKRTARLTAQTNAPNAPGVALLGTGAGAPESHPAVKPHHHASPKLTLRVLKRVTPSTVPGLMRNGIRSKVRCSIACRVHVELRLKDGSRKALSLRSPVIASTTRAIAGRNATLVTVRIRGAAVRALKTAPPGAAIDFTTSYRASHRKQSARVVVG